MKQKNCCFNYPVHRNDFVKLWIDDLICHNLTYGLLNFLSLTHCEAVTSATSSKVRAVKFFHLTFFYTSLCSLSRLGWAVWLMGEITASTKSTHKKNTDTRHKTFFYNYLFLIDFFQRHKVSLETDNSLQISFDFIPCSSMASACVRLSLYPFHRL